MSSEIEKRRRKVLRALEEGPKTNRLIGLETGLTDAQTNSHVGVLNQQKAIERNGHSYWRITDHGRALLEKLSA